MTKIFHLVYRSYATEGFDRYAFIQLLEGDEQTVRELYSKIVKDSRHSDVKILIESKSSLRIVPQWPMHFIESVEQEDSAKSLFELEKMTSESPKDKNLIMPILTKFSNVTM